MCTKKEIINEWSVNMTGSGCECTNPEYTWKNCPDFNDLAETRQFYSSQLVVSGLCLCLPHRKISSIRYTTKQN